jgi:pimeloyl-ACP methyl ester carboxylesterase
LYNVYLYIQNIQMHKYFKILLFVYCLPALVYAQYSDPNIPKPTSGYGADGTHTKGTIVFDNPLFPGHNIEIYYPSDVSGKLPTLFYGHGYSSNNNGTAYWLMDFVAKKGYAIVFVPYETGINFTAMYANMLAGFRKAARDYPAIIDTTKVGFIGHSLGGGASFNSAFKTGTENNWGSNGRFIFSLAPWYVLNLSQSDLQNFPANTKLLIQVYDDDNVNDHRMAIDVFNNINIPVAEKDYLRMHSDTVAGYVYAANHSMPTSSAAYNALDQYGYYRLLDALCDYTFNGNISAKNVALGNGSAAQITMPAPLKPLLQQDYPLVAYPQTGYSFACSNFLNPRQSSCPSNEFVFTGNGNWSDINNWKNKALPPNLLSGDMLITIDPASTGSCILNTPQTIKNATQIRVKATKKLIINGALTISN